MHRREQPREQREITRRAGVHAVRPVISGKELDLRQRQTPVRVRRAQLGVRAELDLPAAPYEQRALREAVGRPVLELAEDTHLGRFNSGLARRL